MKYYCIGIKGTGMSTLAQILSDLGNEVSGYDDARDHKFTQVGLDERNIPIYCDGTQQLDSDTIVTYSVAFKEDHKELVRVRKMGLVVKKYNELLGDVVSMFDTISVAGTHGKTTTSSILKHIMNNTLGCNYFIGAGEGYATKENKLFVMEADEFNRHFLAFHPKYAVITNIEVEHMECYRDIDDIVETFQTFANGVTDTVVACGDNKDVRRIDFKVPVLFYGFDEDNDVVIKHTRLNSKGSVFDLYFHNELYGHFDLPLFGEHMVLNAAAAIIICKLHGIQKEVIHDLLQTFHNAKRRFAEEVIGNTVIIDDYAHHPTEIKVTLEAVKQKYPDKRLVVVFKPNTYSRTKDFTDEFVEAFSIADKTYLTEIDSNREKQIDYPGVTSSLITDRLDNAEIISEETMDKLEHEENSVVCFMSCTYVDHLIENFKEIIKKNN